MRKTRILIGHDQTLVRLGLATMLNHELDMAVVAEAWNSSLVLELAAREHPDIALLSSQMPGMENMEVVKLLQAMLTPVHVIVLTTAVQRDEIFRVFEAGARGYFPKQTRQSDLLEAIRAVRGGERWIPPVVAAYLAEWACHGQLTECEHDILNLLRKHENGPEINCQPTQSGEAMKCRMDKLLGKYAMPVVEPTASAGRP